MANTAISVFLRMNIQRAVPEDAATLTEIAFAAKRHWGYPEQWIELWKESLTIKPEFIANHETFIVQADGEMVGFYMLVATSKQVLLEHLWVLPKAMGRGIGRALFSHAVQRAKALGVEEIQIESDPKAELFYTHMGARKIGANVSEIGGQPRSLPVLIYECS